MSTQSILFDREEWSTRKAKAWLKRNGFAAPKVGKAENYLRYRQLHPKKACAAGSFRTKAVGRGIKMVFCCLKGGRK